MTDYRTYLASRGYRRVTVERTQHQDGDVVIFNTRKAERIPTAGRVVALRGRSNG